MTTADRTFERIESLFDIAQFANVRVLIAGCGSGGSAVALQLVMSGIRNFTRSTTIVCLGTENVIRHVCGRRYVQDEKDRSACGRSARPGNPAASINCIDADLTKYEALSSEIAATNVVVLATDNDPTRYALIQQSSA